MRSNVTRADLSMAALSGLLRTFSDIDDLKAKLARGELRKETEEREAARKADARRWWPPFDM